MQALHGDIRATAIGICAVLFWGMSALLVHWGRSLPAFEVLTISFGLGGILYALWGRISHGGFGFLRQPWHYYAVAIFFVFGCNACYTLALRMSPIVAANLINYLWPLMIVLLSVPMLGRPLRWWHMGGALLGFGGCALLVAGGAQLTFSSAHVPGYLYAFFAAISWAVYSLLLKRFYSDVPVQALAVVFIGVALCSMMGLPADWLYDGVVNQPWRMPAGYELVSVIMTGCCTLMMAYACWDYGAKKGDVRVMGAASYLTPLLSTLVLGLVGGISVSSVAWISCALVIGGALLGSARELFGLKEAVS